MTRLTLLALLLLAAAAPTFAQSADVMPVPRQHFEDATGLNPCSGCKLYAYASGTTTPKDTYNLPTLAVGTENPWPVVMNSAGRPSVSGSEINIYLAQAPYKFILKTSADVTIWTSDAVNPTNLGLTSLTNTGDVVLQADSDNNGANKFSFLNGTSTEVAQIDESGNTQIDGSITVGDGTAVDRSVAFDAVTQDYHVGVANSTQGLCIGRGTVVCTTPAVGVASTGAITLTGPITTTSTMDVAGTLTGGPRYTVSTAFEATGRFGILNTGGGGTTFDPFGANVATSATITSSSLLTWSPIFADNGGGVFVSFPSEWSGHISIGTPGTDLQAYLGLGSITVAGAGITYTSNHIGFKYTRVASGTTSLFATVANGVTESASAALTTVVVNDVLELFVRVISAASVKFYWRKNGSAWSAATELTTNIPTNTTAVGTTYAISNAGVATASTMFVRGASYSR